MIDYREQVGRALRAVAVTSSSSYSWFGRGSRPLPPEVSSEASPDAVREYLTEALQRELYRSFYTQGKPVPWVPGRTVAARPDHAFVAALSRANAGAGGWDAGWRVERARRATVLVEKDGLRVRARAVDCRATGGSCRSGAPVSVRRPKELAAASPGFYTALGDLSPDRDAIEIRVYFNVSDLGAVPLVGTCTRLLNEARIPFSLKVVNHRTGFARCDAAVLYVQRGDFDRVHASLPALASACSSDPPAFARPLIPGVGVGEHVPSLGASFGASRCRLVAEAIVAAHEAGARRLPDRVDAVARRFARQGLDIDVPYLAPGSGGRHEL
jgi:hypothetical protein